MDVIMLSGLPGTGKTTAAEKLEEKLGYDLHSLLGARRELGLKVYSAKSRGPAVELIRTHTEESLRSGRSVIADSTFNTQQSRQSFYQLASEYSVNTILLECVCSEQAAKRRIRGRPANQGVIAEPRNPAAYDGVA